MLYYERKYKRKGYKLIAGVDEAGRGPLAGPVVSAAVILKSASFKNRIDDSKILSAKQRESAYHEIREKAFVGVGIVDEKLIDKVNILQATRLSMKLAVSFLQVSPEFVLVDGNSPIDISMPFENIIGADAKSLSVASASIIAKVTRDRIMAVYHKLWPEYGFSRHKGYGTKEHIDVLRKIGPSPIHRVTFKYVSL